MSHSTDYGFLPLTRICHTADYLVCLWRLVLCCPLVGFNHRNVYKLSIQTAPQLAVQYHIGLSSRLGTRPQLAALPCDRHPGFIASPNSVDMSRYTGDFHSVCFVLVVLGVSYNIHFIRGSRNTSQSICLIQGTLGQSKCVFIRSVYAR